MGMNTSVKACVIQKKYMYNKDFHEVFPVLFKYLMVWSETERLYSMQFNE